MINQDQANLLLNECELWLDTTLSNLRERLCHDHQNTKPMLWELIVLHAAASIISRCHSSSQNNQSDCKIQHEPTSASPDVCLQLSEREFLYLEVAYITPRNKQKEEDLEQFPRWVRSKLAQQKIDYAESVRIRLAPADATQPIQLPPSNLWFQQLKTDNWQLFVAELAARKLPSVWLPEEANLIVEAEAIDEGFGVSSSIPAQNVPEQAVDNPIYETIKRKANQVKAWESSGKVYQPLVLVIGASERLHQIKGHNWFSSLALQKAVYSALADVEQWDWTTTLNLTDNRSWPWVRRRQRVPSSKLISAVVLVTISNQYSGLHPGWQCRASKPLIIKNPHPAVPLTATQECFLGQMDFNQIKYGSGLENWEQQQKGQKTPLLNKYLRESEGRFTFSAGSDFAFCVEIPCRLMARLLVGDISADEIWNRERPGILGHPDSNPSLEQTIGSYLRTAANIKQPVVAVGFVGANPRLREEARICLEFGTFAAASRSDNECFKDSIEFDPSGSLTVTLSMSFVVCILSGKVMADEAWRTVNRQELGNYLKNAVKKNQEIVDAALIQKNADLQCEPQIVFEFGAATECLIRKPKKAT